KCWSAVPPWTRTERVVYELTRPNQASSLSKFVDESRDPVEGAIKIRLRVGVGDAQVVAAMLAEGGAGEERDASLFEEPGCQFVSAHRERADVRKGVEGSGRAPAADAGGGV